MSIFQNSNLIYAFVYEVLIDFPIKEILYDTIMTNRFFVNDRRMIKSKIHLHHSHITGEIIDYCHDLCNLKVCENKMEIPMIVHNLFGFDLYFLIKGYISSAWCSKDLKISSSNLTHINFSHISGEIKFIDTLKYYQKS